MPRTVRPKAKEGKARSRRNELKHGLTSETVLDGLEDAKEYKTFEKATLADFAPATAIKQMLVLRLTSLLFFSLKIDTRGKDTTRARCLIAANSFTLNLTHRYFAHNLCNTGQRWWDA
jgi:hypothetical protein